MGYYKEKSVFQTQKGWYTYELAKTLIAGIRLAKSQIKQNPSTERGKGAQSPIPNSLELLAISILKGAKMATEPEARVCDVKVLPCAQ